VRENWLAGLPVFALLVGADSCVSRSDAAVIAAIGNERGAAREARTRGR
jgi:hypothetical protein